MTRRSLADRVLRLYPRAWRDRYGEEVRDLLDELSSKGEISTLWAVSGLVAAALVQRARSWRWSWRTLAVSGTALAVVAALVVVFTSSDPGHPHGSAVTTLTKGTIPSPNDGTIDPKKVPDFIRAWGRDGKLAGYIPRAYLFPAQANQPVSSKVGGVAPVYASNLKTLVGHFYPGVGFVPLGTSPASEPCTPISTFGQTADGQVTTGTIACPSTVQTVPNIIGDYLPTAMGEVSGDSLQADIHYVHSSSISGGHVISVKPVPGSMLPARSVLTIVSSLGPAMSGAPAPAATAQPARTTVPNTTGLTQAEACATLRDVDLSCTVQTVPSSSVGTGHVVAQAPATGAYVESQSTIVLTVSSGP